MFPNVVKITWEEPSGGTVQALQEGYDLLQQTDNEEKRITSMLIVDQNKVSSYKYKCLVKHETGDQSIFIPIEEKLEETTCLPTSPPAGVYEHSRSLYLFSMTYVMLLVKNMLYFCIIFFLLYKRNSANKGMVKGKAR